MPQIPTLKDVTKNIQLADPYNTPALRLPKDAEEDRHERWKAFAANRHASYPEFICYEWLTGKKKMREGIDFIFQYGISGGRSFLGGEVIDFYFPTRQLGWMVQGLRYHHVTPKQRLNDTFAKLTLHEFGINPVEVFEDDLTERAEYTLRNALNGIQISRRRGT